MVNEVSKLMNGEEEEYDWHKDPSAARRVYYWYEEKNGPGSYEGMVCYVLSKDGVIVQTPLFYLALVHEGDDTLEVILGYGDMEEIKKFAEYYCETHGITKLKWSREVVGKRKGDKIYPAKSFYGKLRTDKQRG